MVSFTCNILIICIIRRRQMAFGALKKPFSLLLTFIIVLQAGITTLATENDSGVEGFVERLYELIMERDSDPSGLKFWTDGLKKDTYTAASVVDFFFTSDEFKSKNMDNEAYVDILYASIMGRECDSEGSNFWVSKLDKGTTRRRVLSDFLWSAEFTNICKSYGVKKGELTLDLVDIHSEKVEFLTQGYKAILGRGVDSKGLSSWLNYLLEGHTALDFITGLISSDEFKNKNLSDEEYIACLYEALLGREAGEAEISGWADSMHKHQSSRMYILKQISMSDEFNKLCETAGLPVGDVYSIENRDRNLKITDYVIKVFDAVFDRGISDADLNYWTGTLITSSCGKDFITGLLDTKEFKNRKLSDEDYVVAVFKAALGREVSEQDINYFAGEIKKNGRDKFLESIFGCDEFTSYCKKVGIPTIYHEGWNNVAGGRVYISGGQTMSGWQRIDDVKYYFDPSAGNVAVTGWRYIDGYKLYFNEDGSLNQDVRSIIGAQSSYYLTVNCTSNTIMVYAKDESGNYNVPVVAFICSTGAGGATPAGTFTTRRLGSWHPLMGDCYGQYCSQINGNILFHSVWYYVNGNPNTQSVKEFRKLGLSVSHGCVRVTTADAKWIYDNCAGCTVKVFYGSENIPFDKPGVPEITPLYGDYAHDPTDIWR